MDGEAETRDGKLRHEQPYEQCAKEQKHADLEQAVPLALSPIWCLRRHENLRVNRRIVASSSDAGSQTRRRRRASS
jgi:hypothetical protein